MPTNFTVSYLEPETNKIHSVYGRWGGYYSGAGQTLIENYKTLDKVKKLVSHGAISVLDYSIGEHDNNTNFKRVDGECLFYHRDRGDEKKIHICDEYDDVLSYFENNYNYFFIDGRWICNDGELSDVIAEGIE